MGNILTTEEMDIVLSGYTIHDKAIKMVIDTINTPFVFHELLPVNENCSFSCWVKGTNGNSITFGTHTHTCNGNWQRIEETDIKNTTNRNFSMKFNNNGSYYFYRMKMEIGNKVTDYGKSQLDYWTTEQLISEISQTSSVISTKIKDLTNGRFTTIEQNVSGLTTRVGNAEGDITELEQNVTGLTTRVGNAEGDITTIEQNVSGLTTTVASKVGNNEIISKINQSAESITISADKVSLSGYVTFTAGDARYDFMGSASTAESNAKSYASGVASTAESNAKTYADTNFDTKGSASTAESNAKSYASGVASTAESNAKSYADDQASTAESNAKDYADGVTSTILDDAKDYADGVGTSALNSAKTYANTQASTAESNAKSYADGVGTSTLSSANTYASTQASTAESNAKDYADTNFDTKGSASTAESNAKTYADNNFDTKGSASTAESNAKTYADNNFDAKGSATSALNSAKDYADDNFDTKGSATSALNSAKTYADGVGTSTLSSANTYADGQASTAESNAKSYASTQASTAESNAKTYADTNFDAKGSATSALNSAKTYANTQASTAESNAKTYADNNFDTKGSANAVKTGLANANYTTINGGNITTGIISGSGTDGRFSINFTTGVVNMENGYFSGTIEANDGIIGGWTIDEDSIYNIASMTSESRTLERKTYLNSLQSLDHVLEATEIVDHRNVPVSPYVTKHYEETGYFDRYQVGFNEKMVYGDNTGVLTSSYVNSTKLYLSADDRQQDIDTEENNMVTTAEYSFDGITIEQEDNVDDCERTINIDVNAYESGVFRPVIKLMYNKESDTNVGCKMTPNGFYVDNYDTNIGCKMTLDGFYAKGHSSAIGSYIQAYWKQNTGTSYSNPNVYNNVASMGLPKGTWMVHAMVAIQNTNNTAGMAYCSISTTPTGEYAPWLGGQYFNAGGTGYINFSMPVTYSNDTELFLGAKASRNWKLSAVYFEAIRIE